MRERDAYVCECVCAYVASKYNLKHCACSCCCSNDKEQTAVCLLHSAAFRFPPSICSLACSPSLAAKTSQRSTAAEAANTHTHTHAKQRGNLSHTHTREKRLLSYLKRIHIHFRSFHTLCCCFDFFISRIYFLFLSSLDY